MLQSPHICLPLQGTSVTKAYNCQTWLFFLHIATCFRNVLTAKKPFNSLPSQAFQHIKRLHETDFVFCYAQNGQIEHAQATRTKVFYRTITPSTPS